MFRGGGGGGKIIKSVELLERVSNTVEFFGGVTFRVIMFQLLCYRFAQMY